MSNPIVHFELGGSPSERVAAFYEKHFGWQVRKDPGSDYHGLTTGEGSIDGGVHGTPEPGTVIYIEVPDIEAAMKAIIEDGGSEVRPATKVTDTVTFAIFQDPGGNKVGLVRVDGANP